MNLGGDAAEQVVRLSLEGMEAAVKISGAGAKELAILLYKALSQDQKTKGKARLTNMLRSGRVLKVYTLSQKDLRKFSHEAKRYGVLYCVLKDRTNQDPESEVDIIARADDASKIQRICERFRFATTDRATVSGSSEQDKEAMFPKEKQSNPRSARTESGHLSEPSLKQTGRYDGKTSLEDRPSVREKLNKYRIESDRMKKERSTTREAVRDITSAVSKVTGKEPR